MKKLLLVFIISFFTASIGFCQNYDLEFNYNFNFGSADTVTMGQAYNFEALAFNHGPHDYNDVLDFRVYVGLGNSFASFNPAITKETYKLNIGKLYNIPVNGTESIQGLIDINPLYFKENSYNIVIIWPTDSYRDHNNKNDFKIIRLFVKSDQKQELDGKTMSTKKIGNNSLNNSGSFTDLAQPSKLSFFPNPAADVLNVLVKDTDNGTLKITDINGRVIQVLNINSTSRGFIPVNLEKAGSKLPNGIYLISLETENYSEVRKFMLFR